MRSTSIGIREAKANLSRIVRMVREGTEVILTDHGRPLGKIVPLTPREIPLDERIRRLEENGTIDPKPTWKSKVMHRPYNISQEVAQTFLEEDRGRD